MGRGSVGLVGGGGNTIYTRRRFHTSDMVLCSHSGNRTHSTSSTENSKMASQLESLSHLQEAYSGLKVSTEPGVRCLVAGCHWHGDHDQILMHCKDCHPQVICWNGEQNRTYTVEDVNADSYHVELVVAYGHLFWLHIKNDLATGNLYAACQQIVLNNQDHHTRFMIRTELCDASGLNCISCSTETLPHTEDIGKIFANQQCAVRALHRLTPFMSGSSLTFSVGISKIYYYQ